ncbi:MAG: hypothetical protein ACLFT1_06625 [Desulfonatronovibrio sp.]
MGHSYQLNSRVHHVSREFMFKSTQCIEVSLFLIVAGQKAGIDNKVFQKQNDCPILPDQKMIFEHQQINADNPNSPGPVLNSAAVQKYGGQIQADQGCHDGITKTFCI